MGGSKCGVVGKIDAGAERKGGEEIRFPSGGLAAPLT